MVVPTLEAALLLLFAAALAAFAAAALFLGVGVVGFVLLVGEEGAGVLLPGEEELLEFLDLGGVALGEVVLFAGVLLHVIELEGGAGELLDELVVARAQEAHGLALADVARKVPIDSRTIECGAGGNLLEEADAVHGLILR